MTVEPCGMCLERAAMPVYGRYSLGCVECCLALIRKAPDRERPDGSSPRKAMAGHVRLAAGELWDEVLKRAKQEGLTR